MRVFFQHHVTDSSTPVVNGDVPNEARKTNISRRILVSTLHCLVLSIVKANPDLSADTKDKIALQVLLDAHHPAVCKAICCSCFLDFLLRCSADILEGFQDIKNVGYLSIL